MGQVKIELNGRVYRLLCGDDDEARLKELAGYLGSRIDGLAAQTGQHGDERLLVMAALLLADELLEMKAAALVSAVDARGTKRTTADGVADISDPGKLDDGRALPADTPAAGEGPVPRPPPLPTLVHDADAVEAAQAGAGPAGEEGAAARDGDGMTIRKLRTLTPAAKSLEARLAEARNVRQGPGQDDTSDPGSNT
ncbi:MAG: cell division protein ZapA [Hyphomicrobiaceae bacterium]